MKKAISCGVALFLMGALLLTHRLEPERRVYPLAMGFDINEGGYEVYYDLPELSVYTGESKPMEESERIWYFEGADHGEIATQIARGKKQTPDMGHVQAIILSRNLIQDQEKYETVLTSFVQEPMLGSSAYVFVTDQIEKVMSVGAKQTDSLGTYLVDIMDKTGKTQPILLQDLYNAYYNQEEQLTLPVVLVNQDEILVER